MLKYYIFEIQGNENGAFAHLVYNADTYNNAESIFYDKCHYAAISTLPVHTVILCDSDGAVYQAKTWKREAE